MLRATAVLFVFACFFTGCEGYNEVINPGTLTFPLRVNLHTGQSFRLPQLGITTTFDSVTSDSRCPEGAMCFWEGDGASRFSIRRDPGPAVTCTLHTTLNPHLIVVNGILLQLTELNPYPRLGRIIAPADYVAVLEIDPAGALRKGR